MLDRRKVFSGFFWKFGEGLLSQGITFVVSVVLSRILMPEDYGTVALVMIFMAFADVFVINGFSTALIQKKEADDVDFSTIFYCSITVSVILYLILFIAAPFISNFFEMPILTVIIRVFSLRLPLSAYNSVQHAYVARNMIFKKFFFATSLGTLVSGIVGIVMAYKGFGVWALIAQYFTISIVDTIILHLTINWHLHLVFSLSSAKQLMNYGWKVLVADLSGTFFHHLRSLLVGKFYSATDLAYYNKGTSMANLLTNSIFTSATSVMFPMLSNESNNIAIIKKIFRKSVQTLSYLIFPLLGICIAVAKPFVMVVFTERWEGSIFYIQILCLVPCVELIGHLCIQGLKATAHTSVLLRNEILNKPPYLLCLLAGCILGVRILALTMLMSSAIGTFINIQSFKGIIGYHYFELWDDLKASLYLTIFTVLPIFFFNYLPIPTIFILVFQLLFGISFFLLLSAITNNDSFLYLINIIKKRF